jgi:hypothetical protein
MSDRQFRLLPERISIANADSQVVREGMNATHAAE